MEVTLPYFDFRFLLCTYLPGVPLSGVIFFLFSLDELVNNLQLAYIIISPLIIGLLIDGFRHSIDSYEDPIEDILEWEEKNPNIKFFINFFMARSAMIYHQYEFYKNFSISSIIAIFLIIICHIIIRLECDQDKDLLTLILYIALLAFIALISYFFGKHFENKQKEINNLLKKQIPTEIA